MEPIPPLKPLAQIEPLPALKPIAPMEPLPALKPLAPIKPIPTLKPSATTGTNNITKKALQLFISIFPETDTKKIDKSSFQNG